MRPGQKIAIGLVGGFVILSALVLLSILVLLPNPTWIGKKLNSQSLSAQSVATPDLNLNAKNESTSSESPAVEAANGLTPQDSVDPESPRPAPSQTDAERRRLVSEKFVDRYLLEDRIQTTVCENLGNSTETFRTPEEFGKQIEGFLLGETKPSATAEAVMLPIEFTLKNAAVRDLVRSAKNAADRGDTGFLQKAQFYAQAARATASVLSSRDEFESISGHAYLLYAIGRAAALKPEILQDPDTNDLCRGIERSAIDGLARDTVFDQGRLMRLLERHGIDPTSINYNPQTSTQLQVISQDGSMQIKMPWLEQIFKSHQ